MAAPGASAPNSLRRRLSLRRDPHLYLAVLAVAVGAAAGYGAVAFRLGIDVIQFTFYGSASEQVLSMARHLTWWHRLLAPALGGLGVGLFIHYLLPERRPHGVADVIESCALRAGRMRLRDGLAAAFASAASIGTGASVGREGPVVHLAAAMAGALGGRLGLDRRQARTLIGCAVASGVAASFNAPIAGVFFALEVVVGHYALGTFAPVVIAAVIGTIITRNQFGDFPAFVVPGADIASNLEMPAFLLLGVVSAVVALLFMSGTMVTARVVEKAPVAGYLKPAAGGLLAGAIAAAFPEVIGVGYETTDLALTGALPLGLLLMLVVAKTTASVLCLGSGFAGGVFSPSLCIGALTGAAFGAIAAAAVPAVHASVNAYALVGMGAVAAAVLGAPISTILIIFELTGDYATTVAVMLAVAAASLITRRVVGGSFFALQLKSRGVDLESAEARAPSRAITVEALTSDRFRTVHEDTPAGEIRELLRSAPDYDLYVTDDDGRLAGVVPFERLRALLFAPDADLHAPARTLAVDDLEVLVPGDTLERALDMLETSTARHLPVVEDRLGRKLIGVVFRADALIAYNRALLSERAAEHGSG